MKFSISHANVWAKPDGCRAYPEVLATYPRKDSPNAEEGRHAHALAERLLNGEAVADDEWADDEMKVCVNMYVDFVNTLHASVGGMARYEAEIDWNGQKGIIDALIDAGSTLFIIDFKYGRRPVHYVDNWQLLLYADAIVREVDGYNSVQTIIYQPRTGREVGSIGYTVEQIKSFGDIARQAKADILAGDRLRQSGSHCARCPALLDCEVALENGLNLFEAASVAGIETDTNSDLRLALVEDCLERLKPIRDVLAEDVEARIRGGEKQRGFELEPGRKPALKWLVDDEAIIATGDLMGVDLRTPVKAVTPAQSKLSVADLATLAARGKPALKLKRKTRSF